VKGVNPLPLQIVADVPTDTPRLGFEEYAQAICQAIGSGEPPRFTIGLYGRWGTGKSSLLRAINRILSEPGYSDVIPVEFDAWRHQRSEQIVVPLLHAVMKQSKAIGDKPLTNAVTRVIRAIGMSFAFKLPYVGATLKMSDVKKAWDEDSVAALDDAFAQPFENLKAVGEALNDRRFAILVDDLDRCTADTVVSVLEAINVITDVSGFVFVLALDYEVLVQSVEHKYPGVNGHEFIQKIIQLPFRIPRLDLSDDSLIAGVIPSYAQIKHLKGISDDVATIIDLAFEANPRAVKRFVNALGLLTRIIEIRQVKVDRRLLAITLGGELRWPEEFEDLRAAVNSGDEDPLHDIRNSDSERLNHYASVLLPSEIDAATLHGILRLTAAFVATEDEEVEKAKKTDQPGTIAYNLPRLTATLEEVGWARKPGTKATFQHARVKRWRFRVLKRVVRLEEYTIAQKAKEKSWLYPAKSERWEWKLERSFSIARETDVAIAEAKRLGSTAT
jgi:hypothetical protein